MPLNGTLKKGLNGKLYVVHILAKFLNAVNMNIKSNNICRVLAPSVTA